MRRAVKMAKPIEMLFGLWTRVGERKHEMHWGAHWRNLANTTEPSVCGGDAALSQISLSLSVHLSVRTLTTAFLDRFSTKVAQR